MTHEVPAKVFAWMTRQSKSAFIGDMLEQIRRNGGLNDKQLLQVKIQYIQAGNDL
jgi:hypothetical protein